MGKLEKIQYLIFGIILGVIIGVIIFSATSKELKEDDYSENFNKTQINSDLIKDKCSDLALFNTTKCLNDFLKKVFVYDLNKTPIIKMDVYENNVGDKYYIGELDKFMSINKVIEEGGVCWQWTNYYYSFFKEFGYSPKIEIVKKDTDEFHSFVIVTNTEGYCVLDQTIYKCFKFGGGDK